MKDIRQISVEDEIATGFRYAVGSCIAIDFDRCWSVEQDADELQALCFAAGANSIFYGEKLLTTGNPDVARDQALFARLGLRPMALNAAVDDRIESCSTTVHAGITEAA